MDTQILFFYITLSISFLNILFLLIFILKAGNDKKSYNDLKSKCDLMANKMNEDDRDGAF